MKKGFYFYFGWVWFFLGIAYLLILLFITDATVHHLHFWVYVLAICCSMALSAYHYIQYKKL